MEWKKMKTIRKHAKEGVKLSSKVFISNLRVIDHATICIKQDNCAIKNSCRT